MPELPEVEQVKKTLAPYIEGKIIKNVEVRLAHLIQYPAVDLFVKKLKGRMIQTINRRGKYLLLQLDKGVLIVHLRMTGALLATRNSAEPPYAKIKFSLTDNIVMWFTDIRAFGTLYYVDDDFVVKGLAALGPEPLTKGLSLEYLFPLVTKSKKAIKTFILDQNVIAGLGNIYADEALAEAGIAPLRLACDVTRKELAVLIKAINKVIAQGIKNHGTTFRDYKDGEGKKGNNQNFLAVYGRGGQPCKKCGAILNKIKVGGRGTVYCPKCQK
ncbi:MAG: bifunctional DNA-formamidopyrimidine glycosylase/DNA-(apurinic or apyrimidinic site) lyase [Phascolarctobacterium sp.]|nr:bifunctional DNA-formamidopyrimidine glycosylase/DNA-(apurinic or apyrimidinic site) lyase [Candidatus Phascolarctobacterium caballi]